MTVTGVTDCAILAILRHRLHCNCISITPFELPGPVGAYGYAYIYPLSLLDTPPEAYCCGGAAAGGLRPYLGAHLGAQPPRSTACGSIEVVNAQVKSWRASRQRVGAGVR